MLEKFKKTNHTQLNQEKSDNPVLKAARKRVMLPAVLAGFTILTTVVLLFAMTTAWYSNVVSTSGLMLEAEAWGFEGEVAVQNGILQAAPGDDGVVAMTITNKSDLASEVTINVTKQYMTPVEMQQRIFFYIEEPAVIQGESVTRQYLNNSGGYTYTLFGQRSLILSEKLHTDARLKWQWVYDVLGYYVRGTMQDGVMEIAEYLRPVEYHYDNATFDAEGKLLTVDGQTTAAAFLAQVTAADGYAGAFLVNEEGALVDGAGNPVTAQNGYYLISSGTEDSVWLYLCSNTEIEAHTRWDTEFGQNIMSQTEQGEEPVRFQARINVTAQQLVAEPVMVSTEQMLKTALTAGGTIRLENSMVLSEPVLPEGPVEAVIDLNGYALQYNGEGYAFVLGTDDRLTLLNGNINGKPDLEIPNSGFYTAGGQLTMSQIEMSNFYTDIQIEDHALTQAGQNNSFVQLVGCTLQAEDTAIKISGDGSLSGERTCLIVQDSELKGNGYVGIQGSGSTAEHGQWGTDIQIIGSQVSGRFTAIYHPQPQSSLTIADSSLSGITGLVAEGGQIDIENSTIEGNGMDGEVDTTLTEEMLADNIWLDTGDGIYVESDYGYLVSIELSGSTTVTTKASSAQAIRVFPASDMVRIRITGGTYGQDVTGYVPNGYRCSGDGTVYMVQPILVE